MQNASPDVIKVLAGNKCDNESLRVVDKADGEKVSTSPLIYLRVFIYKLNLIIGSILKHKKERTNRFYT